MTSITLGRWENPRGYRVEIRYLLRAGSMGQKKWPSASPSSRDPSTGDYDSEQDNGCKISILDGKTPSSTSSDEGRMG
ncbi:hypothetical protein Nepgr_008137 [Nepenthes gracilis]|uniref:Uncharacterized protein n=1 Tax=Nepenthes gracilis TaxID=150966 RepID=A0AAD3XIX8_NEPGR|nr:hypothetical protein Nepgr_008137 [Nepenthes gracilis]